MQSGHAFGSSEIIFNLQLALSKCFLSRNMYVCTCMYKERYSLNKVSVSTKTLSWKRKKDMFMGLSMTRQEHIP